MSDEHPHGRALDNLGPHLLKRRPMPEDKRDYQLEDYLTSHRTLADTLTPQTPVGELGLTRWHDMYAFWAWYREHVLGRPKPTPTPAPSGAVLWKLGPVSDQGQTGHCVGFTGLDWGNTEPINDGWPNQMGHDLYYACKVVDGEPGAEDGSDSRSLCKVLQQRGRIGAYAFTGSADVAAQYVMEHGPVGIGIDWYNSDFNLTAPYVLKLQGGVAGGHEVSLPGYDPATGLFTLLNHWGGNWADKGVAYLHKSDLQKLLDSQGDCWAGLEQPLP